MNKSELANVLSYLRNVQEGYARDCCLVCSLCSPNRDCDSAVCNFDFYERTHFVYFMNEVSFYE